MSLKKCDPWVSAECPQCSTRALHSAWSNLHISQPWASWKCSAYKLHDACSLLSSCSPTLFSPRLKEMPVHAWGASSLSLSLVFSLWCFASGIPATSALLNFDLYLINSVRLLCSLGLSLPALRAGKCLQVESRANHRTHHICFPCLQDHSFVLCLKLLVSYIFSNFLVEASNFL